MPATDNRLSEVSSHVLQIYVLLGATLSLTFLSLWMKWVAPVCVIHFCIYANLHANKLI